MDFELVDAGWDRVLDDGAALRQDKLRIVCPFIKKTTVQRLLRGRPARIQVITRLSDRDFCDGVSDTAALHLLLSHGAQIRGVQRLHAKLYLFGEARAIATSANLTEAALRWNHEFGFVSDQRGIVRKCGEYFERLWRQAGDDYTLERLQACEERVRGALATGMPPAKRSGLLDEGVKIAGVTVEPELPAGVEPGAPAFVKFLGSSKHRKDWDYPVLSEIRAAGCHWALTYPKRPRQVQEGSPIFIGRMVRRPHDTLIFGRAVGLRHVDGVDDASEAEIDVRPWKVRYRHYVRVHHAKFVAGVLSNGLSLRRLMAEFGANSFTSTQQRLAQGENPDASDAYRRQGGVQLSVEAEVWLNDRLEEAYERHGIVPATELEPLDWPDVDLAARIQGAS